MTTTINGSAPSDAESLSVASALKLGRHFGEHASTGALETAYPAASFNGARATVGGVLYEVRNGAWTPVSGDGVAEVATFGDLPAASGVTVGRVYTVLSGLGAGLWKSNGTLWCPATKLILFDQSTQIDGVSGGSASNQILLNPQFPAGVFAGAKNVYFTAMIIASGADANARTVYWRLGANGDSSDASILTTAVMAAGNRSLILTGQWRPISTTSLRTASFASGVPITTRTTVASNNIAGTQYLDFTVANMATTALRASVDVLQGAGSTATISLRWATIEVE